MPQLRLRDVYDIEEKRGIIEVLERRSMVCLARIGMISYHNLEEREFLASAFVEGDKAKPTGQVSPGTGAQLTLTLKTTHGASPGKGTILLFSEKGLDKQAIIGFVVYDDEDKKKFFIDALTRNGQLGRVEEL